MKGATAFIRRARRLAFRGAFVAIVALIAFPAAAVYVGTYQGTPPDGLFYDNVRIVIKDVNNTTMGSGVLLQPKLDAVGNGAWLYVLTSDHVLRGKNPNNIKIGFGQPANPNARVALINNMVLGPKYGNTNDIVDLAMVNVYIANWSGPGGLRSSFPIDPANLGQAATGKIFVAGYGKKGKVDNGSPGQIDIVNNPDSTWDIGYNKGYTSIAQVFTTTVAATNTTYRFLADKAPLRFTRGGFFGNGWPPLYSDSYALPGDSGGPTYQIDEDGNWRVVGIHAAAETAGNMTVVRANSLFTDVDVNSYRTWIDDTYKNMPTPEPASMAVLGIGCVTLLLKRRRRK